MCFLFLGEWGEGSRGTSGKNANLMNSSSGILIGKSISKNVPSCRELLPSPTTTIELQSRVLKPENRTLPSDGAQPHLSWGGDSNSRSWITLLRICEARVPLEDTLISTSILFIASLIRHFLFVFAINLATQQPWALFLYTALFKELPKIVLGKRERPLNN